MVVWICIARTWEVAAGRSRVQSQPHLLTAFKVSLVYVRPCLRRKKSDILEPGYLGSNSNSTIYLFIVFILRQCLTMWI